MTSHGHDEQLQESDFDEPAILIKITNIEPTLLASRYELYERVRGEWAVSLDRVRDVQLALGVYDGRVVEVYRIAGWFHSGEVMRRDESFVPSVGRVEFVGGLASDELRKRYKGRIVTGLFRGQNPIRYVGGA